VLSLLMVNPKAGQLHCINSWLGRSLARPKFMREGDSPKSVTAPLNLPES
jgi:hypothetical protein